MTYLRNAWYVASFANDLGAKPVKLKVMDEPIVLFRTASGAPAAVADRCPHRFAPLSLGKVKGDSIQCPYHGLEFNSAGACVHNPHGDHTIPKAARVKSYPVAERNTIIWLWMGDPEQADQNQILDLTDFYDLEHHSIVYGSYTLKSHYELVLDNLMDLSHAPYLHAGSLSNGETDVAEMRVEMRQEGNTVIAYHRVPGISPTPQFRPFWTSHAAVGDFRADMRWDPPCNLQLDVGITDVGRPVEEGPYIHMTHLLTPVSERETLYFWAAARNSAVGNEEVSRIVQANIDNAFTTEDVPMIDAVQDAMDTTDLFGLKPVLLPGDAAGVRVRRILDKLRAEERSAATST